ncbi:hypothetical protein M407DRAFT_223377 [Tulasnella calospora MUT 4182]|uniref:Uncharacterized protein n=1 Tax=Tulasnella calospora MUT 4182 TaxID=1051891 RepID=A0A0C3KEZ2_9AGAM|nr:hypothetical protein M407DRAFT_221668 [Tulasnella calospora MUT 4182]KIO30647.1 hypothetical protein M407DRAFT_223377 [Tulasnella calospora MUT 4182]
MTSASSDSEHLPSVSSQTTGTRRRRNSSSDDELFGPRRKRRAVDPLVRTGKHVARTIYIKFHPLTILQNGLETLTQHENHEIDVLPSESDNKHWAIFSDLLRLIPDAKRRLTAADGDEYLIRLATAIEEGLSAGRSDDTNGLKKAVAEWVSSTEGKVAKNSKIGRGFHNKFTARLLTPPQFDVNDPATLRDLRDEVLRPEVGEYPPFLYENFTIDKDDLFKGLFKSELLLRPIQAAKHVLIGPSSAESLETTNKSTRLGNAALNGMKEVSLPFIAYICAQVRFALSSDEVFGQNAHSFDIYAFYRNILKMLRQEELADEIEEIRQYWDEVIFGHLGESKDGDELGTMARILKQRTRAS